MATHFDFLAQAKPASLYKLVEKLSIGDAAIVLTGLPHNLAIQTLAFYPDAQQAPLLTAMRDARKVSDQLRDKTAQKVRGMLDAARSAREGRPAAPTPPPAERRPAPVQSPAPAQPARAAAPGPRNPAPNPAATPPAQPVGGPPGGVDQSFFNLEPSASILTGSAPEVFEDAPPAKPPVIPLTPKFSPPRATAQNAMAQKSRNAAQPQQQPAQPAPPSSPMAKPQQPPPAAPAPQPRADPAAAMNNFKAGHNPYEAAPPAHELPESPEEVSQPNSGELIGQAISDLGERIKKAFTPAARRKEASAPTAGGDVHEDGFRTRDPAAGRSSAPGARKKPEPRPADFGKPVPWVPRAATTSPINGPALPGKPPPVVGDPFESPLAQAGLLDLIGRAQEKFMPKGTVKRSESAKRESSRMEPPRRPAAKPGKPEPMEGVLSGGKIKFDATPRVIGPRPKAEELVGDDRVPAPGARRKDGKAILAAILRNAPQEVRGAVMQDDPKLFNDLRSRMFYFDDLIYTEDTALARVFTTAPADTAALALKFAAPRLRDRVLAAVSPGRARALRDTPPRAGLDDIESAQKQVLNVALRLQAAGRILIDPRDPDLAGN